MIFPVYNEEANIGQAIQDFFATSLVDEVVAVDNNSTDRSAAEIQATQARYVREHHQGYGAALQRGMRESTGDILVNVEPDGTFLATDLEKLLVRSDQADAVFGTRTVRSHILPGANMGIGIRWGNRAVGCFIGLLFAGPLFTDAGCTFRLLNRDAYERIRGDLHVNGSHFLVDMQIRCMEAKLRIAEVPVHYGKRIGTSKITGRLWKAARLGFKLIFYSIGQRFRWR